MNNQFCIGIQCRYSSSRLPGKALMSLGETTILGATIQRCMSTGLNTFVLTSEESTDELIASEAVKFGCGVIRGSLSNVYSRYISLAELMDCQSIVRVTADNPFTDAKAIEELLKIHDSQNRAYSRFSDSKLPIGFHAEIFTVDLLKQQDKEDLLVKEHVTIRMRELYGELNTCKLNYNLNSSELADLRCTVDTIEDYECALDFASDLSKMDFDDPELTSRIISRYRKR